MRAKDAMAGAGNLAKQYRSVLKMAEFIEGLENVEGAMQDAERLRAQALSDLASAKNDLVAANEEMKQAKQAVEDNKAEAATRLNESKFRAEGMVKIANDDAAAKMRDAESSAGGMRAKIAHDHETHKICMAKFADEEATARESMEAMQSELAALKERLGMN